MVDPVARPLICARFWADQSFWVGDGGVMSRSGSCGSGMGLNHGGFEWFLEVRFGHFVFGLKYVRSWLERSLL